MKFKLKTITSALVTGGILLGSHSAFANDSDELEKLRALVQDLDQKIRVLDRKNELAEEAAAAKKKETPILNASEKGFGFKSADGNFEIKLKGVVQADGRYFESGQNTVTQAASGASTAGYLTSEDANTGSLLRRVRPTIEGTVFDKYDFRFTEEFGEDKVTSNSGIVDAYIDARFDPSFKLRVGKFKPFVGLERLQSAADIKFIERSYVTNALLPNRDLGAAIHGDLFEGKLNYSLGIYNGVADGGDIKTSADVNKDKDYSARLFATPFKNDDTPLAGLGFGLAATYGDVSGQVKDTVNGSTSELTSGYKSEGQQTIFKYIDGTVLRSGLGGTASNVVGTPSVSGVASDPGADWLAKADGRRYRFAPQASYYYGPFGVLAEYARVSEQVGVGRTSANTVTLNHEAWEIGASYLVTGEDASFKGVKPKQNFDFNKGTWGAWELAARYSELNLDDDTFVFGTSSGAIAGNSVTKAQATALNTTKHWLYADPKTSVKSAHTWTTGINWYLNPEVKFSLNYLYTTFDGGGGPETSTGTPRAGTGTLVSNNSASLTSNAKAKDREDEKAIFVRAQIAF